MRRITWVFWSILAVLAFLWLLAEPEAFHIRGIFPARSLLAQLTGVLAIGCMSLAMLLALRPRWLEAWLDGLDKMYRLHKWLGISALVVSVLHWWWAKGTKWMVGWGWLERPVRAPRPEETLGAVEGWLRSQRGLAESIGEWAFYAAVVMIVLALVKRFPYHLFVKTHKWLALAYLALVWHAVVLTTFDYWTQPVGWALGVLLSGGTVAAVLALTGRIGARRQVQGTIESITDYPALRVLETTVELDAGWPGHAAGQFAFVTSDQTEGAHPYTIASAWNPADRRLTFITKALGDHTSRLRERLKTGMRVTVEGPYGRFDFEDAQPHQIWVGAGIGITPFIARLKHRAAHPNTRTIDLFHTTADYDQAAIDRLTADAAAAGVRLHVLVDDRDGRLNGERIRAAVPQWRSASLWFCGPAGFGQALRADFRANGLPPERFHQELFQMR